MALCEHSVKIGKRQKRKENVPHRMILARATKYSENKNNNKFGTEIEHKSEKFKNKRKKRQQNLTHFMNFRPAIISFHSLSSSSFQSVGALFFRFGGFVSAKVFPFAFRFILECESLGQAQRQSVHQVNGENGGALRPK